MKKKDLFLGGGILFAACVLFLVMNLMQYVQAKESGQKENQEKQSYCHNLKPPFSSSSEDPELLPECFESVHQKNQYSRQSKYTPY